MSVHASVEDQKDQRFVLQAAPFETISMLLEKAVKRFNRTLGPGKEHALQENCILKVHAVNECRPDTISLTFL